MLFVVTTAVEQAIVTALFIFRLHASDVHQYIHSI